MKIKYTIFLIIFLSTVFSVNADIISDTDKFAWSSNGGWLNFKAAHKQARVYDDHLEGYVWSENTGWIRLGTFVGGGSFSYTNDSATSYGVNNDGAGNLSGYAWSSNIGWINFNPTHSQVTVDLTTGDFDGYAWSQNIGWIHFNNVSPAYKVTRLLSGTYRIGVNISGLATGNTLQLTNNLIEDLTANTNDTFYFVSELIDGKNYSVEVTTQPSAPNQLCNITSPTGVINGSDVVLDVTCTTIQYSISGSINGLDASNTVELSINSGAEIIVASGNSFQFQNSLDDGTAYVVEVSTQPTTPNQMCTVSNGNSTISGSNVSNIVINCTTNQYFISGVLSGLIANTTLIIQNNNSDDLSLTTNETFVFSTPIVDQQPYAVTVKTLPSNPLQNCQILNASGSVSGADVMDVEITCSDTLFIDGFE